MMQDILDQIETRKALLQEANKRINETELTPEQWSRLYGVRSLISKLDGKITGLEDSLVKCCACLDYYTNVLQDIKSKPFNKLEHFIDPLDENERIQSMKSLIGGFNTIDDVKAWRQELIQSQSAAMEEITSISDVSDSISEWAESSFVNIDYVEGLIRGLTLSQDKRINVGLISWETIIGIYLGLSKYYLNRYKLLRRK